jgi:CMP-N-acetylneuraminic acid synthetase
MSFTKDDVICIICARGGSKGLPRKNVKLLDGLPLVARPILQAIESGVIGTVLVSTDDIEIAEIAKKYGASVPFLRPSELAQDITTTEDTLKQALIAYEELVNKKFESVFSGHATHKNFWEKDNDGKWVRLRPWMSNYSSRQVRQTVVREDTGIACASRAWLWREGRRIGDKVDIILNDNDFTSIDIHEQKDLQLAEYALKLLKKE